MSQAKSSIIETTLSDAVKSLNASLDLFYPAYNNNGFNERNLTYHFAKEFEKRNGACAFMEVPYYNTKLHKYNKRIDCVVLDQRTAIFIECKRLYNSIKAREIKEDIKRINSKNVTSILNNLSNRPIPKYTYKLIIAETWQESAVKWWDDKPTRLSWDPSGFPGDMYYSWKLVRKYGKKNLYWLYCYQRIKL